MIMAAQLLLSLSILIVVHEWGHFITARMFKIKVEKFYLFFDFLFPVANLLNFSLFKYKKGDTEYGIGWFPLGGYVKIAGMVDESMDKEQMKQAPQPWEFRSKPAWQRLIVMLGGIIVNVIVGISIFIGLTYFLGDTDISKDYVNANGGIQTEKLGEQLGLRTGDKIIKINGQDYDGFQDLVKPDVMLSQGSYYTVQRGDSTIDIHIPSNFIENFNDRDALANFLAPRVHAVVGRTLNKVDREVGVSTVKVQSIASKIGLKAGDEFVEVEGHPIQYYDEVTKIVKGQKHDSLSFKIRRGSEVLSFNEDFRGFTMIGFAARGIDKKELTYIRYGLGQSIGLGTKRAFDVIFLQLKAFRKIFAGEISLGKSLHGPIGIAQAYGGEWDWERFWRMTGLLSMVLAFMNLLPIPALDGGYVMFLLYEMITGREPSEKFFENALRVGMAILLVLMVFVFYNDIAHFFTGK